MCMNYTPVEILVCAKMCDFIEDIEAGGKARLVRIGTVEPPRSQEQADVRLLVK